MKNTTDEEVEAMWRDFWTPILYRDGALDLEQVKKELFDYWNTIREVSLVYDAVTGGKISKCNTAHEHVIDAADEHYEKLREIYDADRDDGLAVRRMEE